MALWIYLKELAQYYRGRLTDFLAHAARERRRLKRSEQLALVMVFHLGIVATAFLVMLGFHAAHRPPLWFYICEGVIIFGCAAVTVRFPALQEFGSTGPGTTQGRPKLRRRKADRPLSNESEVERAESVAGVVLVVAFLVQFGALWSLLWATGGPIQSPFAELTLAIAVFTPFLANESTTILSVVGFTVIYYVGLILAFTLSHDGSSVSTSAWAYFAVNVTILVGAIIFSMIESVFRSAHTGGAVLADPPDEPGTGMDPTVPVET